MSGRLSYSYSKSAIKGADHYITISSTTTRNLAKFGIPRSKISEFAPAVDDSVIKRVKSEKAHASSTVLFSGRLIKEKRLDVWLRILSSATKSNGSINGLIVGSGPDRYNIDRQIWSLGLQSRVRIRNYYPDSAQLYRQIRDSLAVLHTSEREGLGILAIESVMLGTPVLIPQYSPIPDEVKGMCIVGSDKKLAQMLVSMSRGKSVRLKADSKMLSKFSKSHVREFYARLFKKLGAKGR
jgi:glycosyltransferase involved in cell wall biosynthesis